MPKTRAKASNNTDAENSDSCGICAMVVDDVNSIACSNCGTWFHGECLDMSHETVKILSGEDTDWFCLKCKHLPRSVQNEKLDQILSWISSLDDIIKSLKSDLRARNEEVSGLRTENIKLKQEVETINKEMNYVKMKLNKMDQYNLRNNLIISGVPEKKEENLLNVLSKIGSILKVNLPTSEVIAIHRLSENMFQKGNNLSRDIIVKFLRYETKENLLSQNRKLFIKPEKNILSSFIDKVKPSKIYLKDHLTPQNGFLYRRAKKLVKEKKIAFAWIVKGNVMFRVKEGDPAKLLLNEEMLLKISKEVAVEQNGGVGVKESISDKPKLVVSEIKKTKETETEAESEKMKVKVSEKNKSNKK